MNVQQQSEQWLRQLATRKRKPVAPSTLDTYRSGLDRWILPRLGAIELADVKHEVLREFVSELAAAKLSAATINVWTNVVKAIVKSATNEEGEPLYPRHWDNERIDLPILEAGSQKQPYVDAGTIQRVIRDARGRHSALYALLAGTGMRIGEALALRLAINEQHTSWWPGDRLIRIRTQIHRGLERPPKTRAGVRDIDVPEELNEFLVKRLLSAEGERSVSIGEPIFQNRNGRPMRKSTAGENLLKVGVEGFHSFRRFRATHLRAAGVPEDIIKFWMGHASKDITDRYSKLAQELKLRRSWTDAAGLGFELS